MASSYSDAEIEALVPGAVAGDPRAMQGVINLIHPPVVRYCRARLRSDAYPTADDVAQEICLAVATSLPRYTDNGRPFMSFVYGIASHKVVDAYRATGRDVSTPVEDVPENVHPGIGPEEEALIADSCNEIRDLLDVLSDKAREIIILRVFLGLSAEETAEITGSTPVAVRVAQHRALAKLRKTLVAKQETA